MSGTQCVFQVLTPVCAAALQWHITPEARRQWEKYSAMIAAAEALESPVPESLQPESPHQSPSKPAEPSAAQSSRPPGQHDAGGSGGAAAAHRPAETGLPAAASIEALSPDPDPESLAKRRRITGAGSAAHGAADGGCTAQLAAALVPAASKAAQLAEEAAAAEDRSMVHDTVGCVVVDAQGAQKMKKEIVRCPAQLRPLSCDPTECLLLCLHAA